MKKIFIFSVLLLLNGCTLSLVNTMTSGTASDVVDSDPSTEAKTDAKLSVPLSPF